MPKYNFVRQKPETITFGENNELGIERVTAEYRGEEFDNAVYYNLKSSDTPNSSILLIKNCLESLILIDKERKGLNKLHIGDLEIRNPHIEAFNPEGGEGPRIDLHEVDCFFAHARLEELLRWTDPQYRDKLRDKYALPPIRSWYSTVHRVIQLQVSKEKLQQEIRAMGELLSYLRTRSDSSFVSDQSIELEEKYDRLKKLMQRDIQDFEEHIQRETLSKKQRKIPKIIYAPKVLTLTQEMHNILGKIINFVESHERVNVEKAGRYWNDVDSWGIENVVERLTRDFNFQIYDPLFIEHLRRHFPGGFPEAETLGSVFNNFFHNPRYVIHYALTMLRKYNGKHTIQTAQLPMDIGLDGVISLDELPAGVEIRRELRDNIREVNVVSEDREKGLTKKPTNQLVVIAGLSIETKDKHGFKSIYPGKYCPDLTDGEFWDKHAFIRESYARWVFKSILK